jgi:hypothetical protein
VLDRKLDDILGDGWCGHVDNNVGTDHVVERRR